METVMETRTIRVEGNLYELVATMQSRLDEKQRLIERGKWRHWKQMLPAELLAGLDENVTELKAMLEGEAPIPGLLVKAADTCNLVLLNCLRSLEQRDAAKAAKED